MTNEEIADAIEIIRAIDETGSGPSWGRLADTLERMHAVAVAAKAYERARRAALLELDPIKRAVLNMDAFQAELDLQEALDHLGLDKS